MKPDKLSIIDFVKNNINVKTITYDNVIKMISHWKNEVIKNMIVIIIEIILSFNFEKFLS